MEIANIRNAEALLSKLIERAENGEEVVITRDGKPVVKIVPYCGTEKEVQPRQGGQWKGQVWMADDFDEWPPEIASAFGITPE